MEAPADEEDTAGRNGLVLSGIEGYFRHSVGATRAPPLPLPPIGYHGSFPYPNTMGMDTLRKTYNASGCVFEGGQVQ